MSCNEAPEQQRVRTRRECRSCLKAGARRFTNWARRRAWRSVPGSGNSALRSSTFGCGTNYFIARTRLRFARRAEAWRRARLYQGPGGAARRPARFRVRQRGAAASFGSRRKRALKVSFSASSGAISLSAIGRYEREVRRAVDNAHAAAADHRLDSIAGKQLARTSCELHGRARVAGTAMTRSRTAPS